MEEITNLGNVHAKIMHTTPAQFRILQKLDGSSIMQAGYNWVDHTETGIEWRDVPIVAE